MPILRFLSLSLLVLGYSAFARDYYPRENSPLSGISSVAQLREYLKKVTPFPPTDIEGLLGALPEPLLSRPVFVHSGHSLQASSFASPRVILSDPTGDLVLTFNGEKSQAGYEKIEAMEFEPIEASYYFYELGYSDKGELEVSPPNPAKCLTCHRAPNPRPNWESYDQWPSVYGSRDDALSPNEVQPFLIFLQGLLKQPRYSALKIDHLRPVLNYSSHHGRLPLEPNISFTHRLSRNNFKRVARLIMESKDYNRFKYVIAACLNSREGERCSADGFVSEPFDALTSYYSRAQREEAQGTATAITVRSDTPGALVFRSLFESRGIDVSDWFMNFKGSLTNTFLNGVTWQAQLLEALVERDPSLQRFMIEGTRHQLDQSMLEEASIKLFPDKGESPRLRTFTNDPAVPKRIWRTTCRQCHQVKELTSIPQFSFAAALRHPRFAELIRTGAMPKDQVLTASQKSRLLQFQDNIRRR